MEYLILKRALGETPVRYLEYKITHYIYPNNRSRASLKTFQVYDINYNLLTTNFLCLRYWYWHNSQHGGPLLRLFETSSHFYNEDKRLRSILVPADINHYVVLYI